MSKPTVSLKNRTKFANVQERICKGIRERMEPLDDMYTSGTTGRFGFHYRHPSNIMNLATRNCFTQVRQKNKRVPGKGERQWFWEGPKRWSS